MGENSFDFVRSQAHRTNKVHIYFSLAHDFIAHDLIVAQINSAQVVMFLEKAQFFFRTNFFFQGIAESNRCNYKTQCLSNQPRMKKYVDLCIYIGVQAMQPNFAMSIQPIESEKICRPIYS